jgi:predicted MFS family arabinose efflux permease
MVQRGRLMNAIALNSAAFNGARIVGPVIAGLAIAAAGVAACFYINAASFLAAIVALSMIKRKHEETLPEGYRHTVNAATLWRDLSEGLRFVKNERDIFRIMLLVSTYSLFGIPFVTFLPVFAEDILKVGPKGLGFLAGSSGVGALCAALIIAFRGEIKKKGSFMSISGLTFCASLVLFSLSRNYPLSCLALAFSGWGIVSFLATANSFIQLSTPDVLRGRVMSIYALVFLGVAPIGSYIIGHIAALVGTPGAVCIGSVICFIASISLSGYLRTLEP